MGNLIVYIKMTTYWSSNSGFFVELIDRELELAVEFIQFQFANLMTAVGFPIMWPWYTTIVLISLSKTYWWEYMPTSNLESFAPNAYFYWIYNILFIPLPEYGQHQMYRTFLYWICYPLLVITSPISAILSIPLSSYVAFKIFMETAWVKFFATSS